MTQKLGGFLVLLVTVTLSACQIAPLDVHAYSAAPSKLAQLSTFEIHARAENKGPYLALLSESATEMLMDKGYQQSEEADIVVIYQISVNESSELRVESTPVLNRVYNRPTLEAVYEATILVNAIERATGTVLWKASSMRDLTQVSTSKFSKDRADRAMSEIFDSFPVHED